MRKKKERKKREAEEEGHEYEPLLSVGSLFDLFDGGKKNDSSGSK